MAVICAGLYFLIAPKVAEHQAEQVKKDLLDQLEQNPDGVVQVKVDRDLGAFAGETPEIGFEFEEPDPATLPDEVTLQYVGRLVIPKISLITPVANDVSYQSLRFGVGIHPQSAPLTDVGKTSIFGHRYISKGRDFNRANELEVGDKFYIDYNVDGKRHFYEVFQVDYIQAKEIEARFLEPFQENVIMFVTCHPATYGDFSQRLLIYSKPTHSEPIPPKTS